MTPIWIQIICAVVTCAVAVLTIVITSKKSNQSDGEHSGQKEIRETLEQPDLLERREQTERTAHTSQSTWTPAFLMRKEVDAYGTA